MAKASGMAVFERLNNKKWDGCIWEIEQQKVGLEFLLEKESIGEGIYLNGYGSCDESYEWVHL